MIAVDRVGRAARHGPASSPTTTEVRVEWHHSDARRPRVPARRLHRPRARGRRARARSRTSTGCCARCTACCGRAPRSCSPTTTRWRSRSGATATRPARCRSGTLEVRRSYFDARAGRGRRTTASASAVPAHDRRRVRGAAPRRLPRRRAPRARAAAQSADPGPTIPTVDHLAGPQRRRLSARSAAFSRAASAVRCRARAPSSAGARTASSSLIGPSSRRSSSRNVERLADDRARAARRGTPSPGCRRAAGRIFASSSCSRSSAMRASSSSMRRAERGGLARVARRAVAARELVQVVEQRARRRARTGGPRCRSSPCGTCGSAGAARRAWRRRRRCRSGSAARAAARAPCARRPPRGGGTSRPAARSRACAGLPTSCSSAASRSCRARRRLGHDRDRVREHVLVPVDRILFELHRVELGQELVRRGRCARSATARPTDRRRRAASTARRGSAPR